MSQHPPTFGQLLLRLTSDPPATSQCQGPFIASAMEANAPCPEDASPLWVILHSITECDMRLIHSRPLAGGQLMVRIPIESGEVLNVRLTTGDSEKRGDLYESVAQFI